ncbi:MAG: hypothetical protein HOM44_08790 [Gammaproteobacteria bacterium]|jgi:hypothetical protein|nr:hypothetical protein [Gammaproteobacteria bacterium]
MRFVFGALLVFSLWQSSMILFAGTMLRLHGSSGGEFSVSQISLAREVDNRDPNVLAWLLKYNPLLPDRLNTARQLTKLEPFLGSAWANLFELKLASRELDGEAELALARAVEFSPYDPIVQEKLVRAGVAGWLAMPPNMRQTLIAVAADMLNSKASHRASVRRDLVRDSGWLPLVCKETTHTMCSDS